MRVAAWESGGGEGGEGEEGAEGVEGGEGWAQFDAFAAPPDAFASAPAGAEAFAPYWPSDGDAAGILPHFTIFIPKSASK